MTLLIIFFAKYLLVFLLVTMIAFAIKLPAGRRRRFLILTLFVFVLSFVFSRVAARFYFDPRPFVVGHFVPLIPHAPDNGFPSDHALLSFAIATAIFVFDRRWGAVLFLGALFISAGRVFSGVHTWFDIFGSLVIVLVSTVISWPFVTHINKSIFCKEQKV